MLHKKAASSQMMYLVITLIIMVLAYLVYINITVSGSAKPLENINAFLAGDSSCKGSYPILKMQGAVIDEDGDKRPDYCDICACNRTNRNECPDTNNDFDADNDTIPAACDMNDNDPKTGLCSSALEKAKGCKDKSACGKGGKIERYATYFRCVIS